MIRLFLNLMLIGGMFTLSVPSVFAQDSARQDVEHFLDIVVGSRDEAKQATRYIDEHWQASFTPMVLESLYLSPHPHLRPELIAIMSRHTGQNFHFDTDAWYQWLWSQPEKKHPHYAEFKSQLYRLIDPRFARYFDNERRSDIRLDEVRWGGVVQDGIPPLRGPKMLAAADADYLEDDNIVFGLIVNGDARAYPKRILAWHEMFVDRVGGVDVAGVYCTLCGSMILYETDTGKTNYALGTSGFLYRSNKLMYDQTTQSMWNTVWGAPVIGPLAGKDIQLKSRTVVTTTWGEWKKRHPKTTVLSLDTGHRRDYGEGVAYHDYFSTDRLMFTVPKLDVRLDNKAEVLALRFAGTQEKPLAISSAFLKANPLYHGTHAGVNYLIVTDESGAHRAYETGGLRFTTWDQGNQLTDEKNVNWTLSEDQLTAENTGSTLQRLPSHNAFWFGWNAANPNTILVK